MANCSANSPWSMVAEKIEVKHLIQLIKQLQLILIFKFPHFAPKDVEENLVL